MGQHLVQRSLATAAAMEESAFVNMFGTSEPESAPPAAAPAARLAVPALSKIFDAPAHALPPTKNLYAFIAN